MIPANPHASQWRYYLTRERIKRYFRAHICAMARDACEEGCVEMASIHGKRIMGVVNDEGRHTPMVEMVYGYLQFNCSCDHMDYADSCIHGATILTYAVDNLDRMLEEEEAGKDRAAYFVSRVSEDRVRDFAAEIMHADPYTMHAFIERFGLRGVLPPRDYAGELNRMYARQAGNSGGMLDLGRYFTEAMERRGKDDHAEAAKMYRDASRQMRLLAGTATDTNGYYTDCCIEAIENMAEVVARQGMGFEGKREYVEFLLGEALAAPDPKIIQHYRSALDIICSEADDLAAWEEMLASRMAEQDAVELECRPEDCGMPKDGQVLARAAINPTAHKKEATAGERRRRLAAAQAAQEVLAGMHAHVLAQTGRLDQALSVLEGRVSKNRDLCLAYLRMLRGTDPEKARRGALDAVAAHPDDVQVIDAAIESIPPDAPERVGLLGNAFEATGERSYLQEIKRATDDWESVAVGLIERLAGRSMDKAIDVCTKEGMHGKAMEMLEKNGDVGAFKKYTKRLGKSQPERYVAAYGRALESFAKGRSGKEHYQRIADHLESIIEMPGSEGAGRVIAERIRRQNPGKRNLVAILKHYCTDKRSRAPMVRGRTVKLAAGRHSCSPIASARQTRRHA